LMALISAPLTAAYITDKLVAGLHEEADASSSPIAALASGTPMEVLERKNGFSKVRLTNGDLGWVESDFVTNEKPARVMLLENQADMADLKRQIRQKDAALEALKSSTGDEPEKASSGEVQRLKNQLAELQKKLDNKNKTQGATVTPVSNDEALTQAEAQIEEQQALLAESNSVDLGQEGLADENRALRQRLNAAAELLDISDLADNTQAIKTGLFNLSIMQWLLIAAAAVLGLLMGMAIIGIRQRNNFGSYRI